MQISALMLVIFGISMLLVFASSILLTIWFTARITARLCGHKESVFRDKPFKLTDEDISEMHTS